MNDFIAEQDRALLERHGLANYDALWARACWQHRGSLYRKEMYR
jgi:hypothetical protein